MARYKQTARNNQQFPPTYASRRLPRLPTRREEVIEIYSDSSVSAVSSLHDNTDDVESSDEESENSTSPNQVTREETNNHAIEHESTPTLDTAAANLEESVNHVIQHDDILAQLSSTQEENITTQPLPTTDHYVHENMASEQEPSQDNAAINTQTQDSGEDDILDDDRKLPAINTQTQDSGEDAGVLDTGEEASQTSTKDDTTATPSSTIELNNQLLRGAVTNNMPHLVPVIPTNSEVTITDRAEKQAVASLTSTTVETTCNTELDKYTMEIKDYLKLGTRVRICDLESEVCGKVGKIAYLHAPDAIGEPTAADYTYMIAIDNDSKTARISGGKLYCLSRALNEQTLSIHLGTLTQLEADYLDNRKIAAHYSKAMPDSLRDEIRRTDNGKRLARGSERTRTEAHEKIMGEIESIKLVYQEYLIQSQYEIRDEWDQQLLTTALSKIMTVVSRSGVELPLPSWKYEEEKWDAQYYPKLIQFFDTLKTEIVNDYPQVFPDGDVTVQKKMAALELDNTSLEEQIKHLVHEHKVEMKKIKAKAKECAKQLQQAQKELDEREPAKIVNNETNLPDIALPQKEAKIADDEPIPPVLILQGEVRHLRQEAATLKGKLDKTQAKLENRDEKCDKLQDKIAELQDKIAELMKSDSRQEYVDTKNAFDKAMDRCHELKTKLEAPLIDQLERIVRDTVPLAHDFDALYTENKKHFDVLNAGAPLYTCVLTNEQKRIFYILILLMQEVMNMEGGNYVIMQESSIPADNNGPRIVHLRDPWVAPIHQMCMLIRTVAFKNAVTRGVMDMDVAQNMLAIFLTALNTGLTGVLNPELQFGLCYSDRTMFTGGPILPIMRPDVLTMIKKFQNTTNAIVPIPEALRYVMPASFPLYNIERNSVSNAPRLAVLNEYRLKVEPGVIAVRNSNIKHRGNRPDNVRNTSVGIRPWRAPVDYKDLLAVTEVNRLEMVDTDFVETLIPYNKEYHVRGDKVTIRDNGREWSLNKDSQEIYAKYRDAALEYQKQKKNTKPPPGSNDTAVKTKSSTVQESNTEKTAMPPPKKVQGNKKAQTANKVTADKEKTPVIAKSTTNTGKKKKSTVSTTTAKTSIAKTGKEKPTTVAVNTKKKSAAKTAETTTEITATTPNVPRKKKATAVVTKTVAESPAQSVDVSAQTTKVANKEKGQTTTSNPRKRNVDNVDGTAKTAKPKKKSKQNETETVEGQSDEDASDPDQPRITTYVIQPMNSDEEQEELMDELWKEEQEELKDGLATKPTNDDEVDARWTV